VFFAEPHTTSHVSGLTLECRVVHESIVDNQHTHAIENEFLRILVEHDGSNPFCDAEECMWGFVFTMSTSEVVHRLSVDDECVFEFICMPQGVHITNVIVTEETIAEVTGIWLFLFTNDISGEYDLAFALKEYGCAN
jgi:hypothetical protein